MSAPGIDFCGVLSETKRIVNAHSRHFLALSVLFLLPLSFFIIAAPTFHNSLFPDTNPPETLLRYAPPNIHNNAFFEPISLFILYVFAILFLSLSATATVSHSVFHAFFGRPVRFMSALKSLPSSLCRLFITALYVTIAVAVAAILFTAIALVALRSLSFLDIRPKLPAVAIGVVVIFAVLAGIYLQANWALAPVVAVAESSWGVDPLRRSTYLLKGARGVAVSLGLLFAFGIGCMLWLSSFSTVGTQFGSGKALPIVETVLVSAMVMLMFLNVLATNTVMYMYCKALQGELAGEIAAEFAREYISLPFDEQKMPHIITVVEQPQF